MFAALALLVLVLLLFGGQRIAATGRELGEAIRNFKQGLAGEPEPLKVVKLTPVAPKLLPAKGESSASRSESEPTDP